MPDDRLMPQEVIIRGIDPAMPGSDRTVITDYCTHGNCHCACIAAARETFAKGYDARKLRKLFEAIKKLRANIVPSPERTVAMLELFDAFDDLKMEM